jgi:hypothetical protein
VFHVVFGIADVVHPEILTGLRAVWAPGRRIERDFGLLCIGFSDERRASSISPWVCETEVRVASRYITERAERSYGDFLQPPFSNSCP